MLIHISLATIATAGMIWPVTRKPRRAPFMSYRKVGGLRFWRIGRLGGSFYLASNKRES